MYRERSKLENVKIHMVACQHISNTNIWVYSYTLTFWTYTKRPCEF